MVLDLHEMFRCVLSAARDVPFSSYSRRVAWLRHARRAATEGCLRSPTCNTSARFSSLSRWYGNVRCGSSNGCNSRTLPSPNGAPQRIYSSSSEDDGEKRKEEEEKAQELGSSPDDGLDDEFRDLLKEITNDFGSGDGEKEKQTPSDSNMNAASHSTCPSGPLPDVSFADVQGWQQPQNPPPMAEEIEDFTFYDEEAEAEAEPEKVLPVKLTRGERGVYDLEDLMKVLASMNGLDPCVIRIPPSKKYVEHMVIVSALSHPHMKAIAHEVIWSYKRKKADWDPHIQVEGVDTSREWFALDMGNIGLHIFMPEARQRYDLETLWCLGPENDPQCQEDSDPYTLTPADLFLMEVNKAKLAEQRTNDQGGKSTVIITGHHDNDDEVLMGLDNRPPSHSRSRRSKIKNPR